VRGKALSKPSGEMVLAVRFGSAEQARRQNTRFFVSDVRREERFSSELTF